VHSGGRPKTRAKSLNRSLLSRSNQRHSSNIFAGCGLVRSGATAEARLCRTRPDYFSDTGSRLILVSMRLNAGS
jgi:hypothetical protein